MAFARYLVTQGRLDESVPYFERAAEIDPEDWQSPLLLDSTLVALGEMDKAERYARLGIKRAEASLKLHPENSRPAQLGAATLARLGERERAVDWLDRALFLDPDDAIANYNAACTFAQLGENDKAFAALEKWASASGSEMESWFETDSDFDPIRKDPRFVAIGENCRPAGRLSPRLSPAP